MSIFFKILAWFASLFSPAPPEAAPVSTKPTSILTIIENENPALTLGPFKSGGVIHHDLPTMAQQVADFFGGTGQSLATVYNLMAVAHAESRFDPTAVDPNLQDAPNGKWPTQSQQDAHTDYGLFQIDGDSTCGGLEGMQKSLAIALKKINDNQNFANVHNYPREVAYEAYNSGEEEAEKLYLSGGVAACAYGHEIAELVDSYVAQNVQ